MDRYMMDDPEDVVITPRIGSIDGSGVVPRSSSLMPMAVADTGQKVPSPGADRRMLKNMNVMVNDAEQNIRDARTAGYAEKSPRMVSLGTDLVKAVGARSDSVKVALDRKRKRMGR